MSKYGFRITTLSIALVLGLIAYAATDGSAAYASVLPTLQCWF